MARQQLRVSEEEFWDLAPDDLTLLLSANHEEYRRFYQPFAMIMAGLASTPDKPIDPEDLMPKRIDPEVKKPTLTKLDEGVILAKFRNYQAHYQRTHGTPQPTPEK